MAPPVLSPYEYVFGDNGFILNTDSNALPFVDITDITGLDGAPIRQNTTEFQGIDGTYINAQFMSSRTIVLTGTLYSDPANPDAICDILRAEYGPPDESSSTWIQPFYYQHPGVPVRFIRCQGGGAKYDVDTNRRLGLTSLQLTLFASDPYIYEYYSKSTGIAVPAQGQLNTNSTFETGLVPWTAVNNATLALSGNAYTGNYSMQLNGNGSTSTPGAISEFFTVTASGTYSASCVVYTVNTYSSGVQVGIHWYTSGQSLISSSTSTATATVGGAWTNVSLGNVTAPSNAAYGVLFVQAVGTPSSGTAFYFDQAAAFSVVGKGFNTGFNTGFGGPIQFINNSLVVAHNGTHTAYPKFTLQGPLTNPVISDSLSSNQMKLTLTLAAKDSVVIDCRYKTMVLNGSSSVRSAYSGLFWFSVPPGGSDTFYINSDSGQGSLTTELYATFF